MCTGRTDFEVNTSRFQNEGYFQGVYCIYCNTTNSLKTIICGAAINSLEITLILKPTRSDVKIGPPVHMEIG